MNMHDNSVAAFANAMRTAPFGDAALNLHSHGLAVLPVGGVDGKKPLVKWRSWKRPPSLEVVKKFLSKFPSENVGIICDLSGVTVVDIDDPALIDAMVSRFGDTPLKTRTPSGGVHLWYLHYGERCTTLRHSEGLPVDIKGVGGVVVVPPSVRRLGGHAGEVYGFLEGSWDNLRALPKMRDGSLPAAGKPIALRAVAEGRRNEFLFKNLLREARDCASFDALLSIAIGINSHCVPPLSDAEVRETAASAWDYEISGKNWAGKEARMTFTSSEYRILLENPDAFALFGLLRQSHGARNQLFAVSPKGMSRAALIPGWGRRRFEKARDWLVERGFLTLVHEGGKNRGDEHLFALSSPIGNKGRVSRPNINKHPPLPSAWEESNQHKSAQNIKSREFSARMARRRP